MRAAAAHCARRQKQQRAHYCNYKHSNTTIYTAGLLLTVTRNERSTHEHKMCTTLRPRSIEMRLYMIVHFSEKVENMLSLFLYNIFMEINFH